MTPSKSLQTYAIGAIRRAGATATTCPNIQGGIELLPDGLQPDPRHRLRGRHRRLLGPPVKTVAPADVKPGQIFLGGAGTNNGVQTGSITAIDVATGKQVAKRRPPYPMYSGVLATPDLVWSGSLDGTFAAYDAKTLEVKWSMNVGTAFQGSPIAFTAGGKEYIAIAGGSGGTTFGHTDLENMQTSQMLYVFAL